MEIVVLVFGLAYLGLMLWGLSLAVKRYLPAGRALLFPRMAERVGVSVEGIADSGLAMHLPTAGRICTVCKSKDQCAHWLEGGESAAEAPEFCPNRAYLGLARQEQRTGEPAD